MKHPEKPDSWCVEREMVHELSEGYKETIRLLEGVSPAPTVAYISYRVELLEHLDLFVTGLWVPAHRYRQGWGTWILEELIATYPGWPITLQAIPGRAGLTTEDLYTFYRKAGFVQQEGSRFVRPGVEGWKPLPAMGKGAAELRAAAEARHLARRPI